MVAGGVCKAEAKGGEGVKQSTENKWDVHGFVEESCWIYKDVASKKNARAKV